MSARVPRPHPPPHAEQARSGRGRRRHREGQALQLIAEQLSAQGWRCSWPTSRAICRESRRRGRRTTGCADRPRKSARNGRQRVSPPSLHALGGLSTATAAAGVILRSLTAFEAQGTASFFGEPEFDTAEFLRMGPDGRGTVSVLEPAAVHDKPQLFSTFLRWLPADLFHVLPPSPPTPRRRSSTPSRRRSSCSARKGSACSSSRSPQGRARRRPCPARQPLSARPEGLHP